MKLGEYNTLTLLRLTTVGAYLGDGEEEFDVLLPNKYVTNEMEVGKDVEVFLYLDSEDRLIATTLHPLITINTFAYLEVEQVNLYGAFMNWGVEKGLMVPYKQQKMKLVEGGYYLTYLLMDEPTQRLIGSTKVSGFLSENTFGLEENQEMEMLICDIVDLGLQVIVNDKYHGLIYHNDLIRKLRKGTRVKGYISKIREDGKLDMRLEKSGIERIEPNAERLMQILGKNNGKLMLTDKSSPEDIRDIAGMSKKIFKQAVGNLYKQRIITLENDCIRLS